MPYKSRDEANPALRGIEPSLTLEQMNLVAEWADAMEKADDGPESPWGAAIAQFKRLYESDDERWTKREVETQEAVTCECLECGNVETLPDGTHCADVKCSQCGGTLRRVERPGRGQLQLSSNSFSAQVRREVVDGITYLVAPAVLLKQDVLNNEMVLADEIEAHFRAWNGRPVVVAHPEVNGVKVSANDPAILAQQQVGKLFNVTFNADTLRGELWIDKDKAKGVVGGGEVLRRLQGSTPTEISTAYFRDREATAGGWQGKRYGSVARNLRPDHVAILLSTKGACNWADGCGAPRVNEEDGMATTDENETSDGNGVGTVTTIKANDSGVLCALKTLFSALGVKFNQDNEEVDKVNEFVTKIVEDGRLALTEEQLADVPEEALAAIADLLETMPEEEAEVEAEAEAEAETEDEEKLEAQEQAPPVPQANEQDSAALKALMARVKALEARGQAESAERKAELTAALTANEACAFTAKELSTLAVDTLETLHRSLSPADYCGQGGGPVANDRKGLVEMTMPDIFAKREVK